MFLKVVAGVVLTLTDTGAFVAVPGAALIDDVKAVSYTHLAGALTVPAQAREVFDVSGAGDTVIAVTAAMLAAGLSEEEAVRIANRAGGIVVGKLGTASVSFEELFCQDH